MAEPDRPAPVDRSLVSQSPATTGPATHPSHHPGEGTFRGTSGLSSAPTVGVGTSLGLYFLLEKLGEGGMGAVYKARHTRLNKLVAVKVLTAHLTRDPAALARFDREMKAAGALEHPNIVRAMDADEHQGTHYLVMEYIEGQDLHQLIKQRGPLSVTSACTIVRQAAIALAHAHQHGLVHRDIKPSNLLLTRQGQLKLLDLGLARLGQDEANEALTNTGVPMGTPDYMSPEQWADTHSADARCDLYAVGCTLFYLLTGRAPFGDDKHKSVVSKLTAHVHEPPPSLAAARPDAPPELEQLYYKLLAKKLADRLGSAAELAKLLEPFCKSGDSHSQSSPHAPREESGPAESPSIGVAAPSITATWTSPLPAAGRGAGGEGPASREAVPAGPTKPQAERQHPSSRRWLISGAIGALILVLLAYLFPALLHRGGAPITSSQPASSAPSWHGWPADAPAPAIAPFDAAQAKTHQDAWAAYLKVPPEWENSIGMKFRLSPPGEFLMGSTEEEIATLLQVAGADDWKKHVRSESPQHRVILTRSLYLGIHEVTHGQFSRVMGGDAPSPETRDSPTPASWNDAQEFFTRLNAEEQFVSPTVTFAADGTAKTAGAGYCLPTEAEWEYACRGGASTLPTTAELELLAWHEPNSSGRPHHVGTLKANPFGLFDMQGNMWEHVFDVWEEKYFEQFAVQPALDPRGPASDSKHRGVKGGSWRELPIGCRVTDRGSVDADVRDGFLGFRAAVSWEAVKQAIERSSLSADAP